MKRYQWIVFDSTGTLMATAPEPAQVYHEIGKEFGSRRSVDQIRDDLRAAIRNHFFGESALEPTDEARELRRWRKIVADALPDMNHSAFEDAFKSLWRRFASADSWRLFDDVTETLLRLRSRGYQIAVASNFDQRLRLVLEEMNATDLFDEILISSELGWSKPDTRFYDTAKQRLDAIRPGEPLMIGDTYAGDVRAAEEAGWDARHLIRNHPTALAELTSDL